MYTNVSESGRVCSSLCVQVCSSDRHGLSIRRPHCHQSRGHLFLHSGTSVHVLQVQSVQTSAEPHQQRSLVVIMGSLIPRLITAAIFVPSVVSSILGYRGIAFAIFLLIMALKGLEEYHRICSNILEEAHILVGHRKLLQGAAYVSVTALLCSAYVGSAQVYEACLALIWSGLAILHIFVINLDRTKSDAKLLGSHALISLALHFLGLMYIGWTLACSLRTMQLEHGAGLIVAMLLTSWASDGAAYIVGGKLGRTPLRPLSARRRLSRALLPARSLHSPPAPLCTPS